MAEIDATTEDFELGFYSLHTPPYYAEWNQHQVFIASQNTGYSLAHGIIQENGHIVPCMSKISQDREYEGDWGVKAEYDSEKGSSVSGHLGMGTKDNDDKSTFRSEIRAEVNDKGDVKAEANFSGKF